MVCGLCVIPLVIPCDSLHCRIELYWIKAAPLRSAAARLPRRAPALRGPPGARRASTRGKAPDPARLIHHASGATVA